MADFSQFIAENEPALRLGVFLAMLMAMAGAEALWPRRAEMTRALRWPRNLGLVLIDTLTVRALAWALPVMLPAAAAAIAAERGWGLFPALGLDGWPAFWATLILFDLAIYAQHVAVHHIPVLWRLHRVHHTDTALDATSGLRFHPLEIVLSIAIKVALVLALGAPAAGKKATRDSPGSPSVPTPSKKKKKGAKAGSRLAGGT